MNIQTQFKLTSGLLCFVLLTGCQVEDAVKDIPILGTIYRLPDIDQKWSQMPYIDLIITHRSILTHNALIPLICAWLCRPLKYWGTAISLFIGTLFSLHFYLDLFPKKWSGYAFIHLPLLGWMDWVPFDNNWIPTLFSIFWLGCSLLLSQFSFILTLTKDSP